MQEITQSAFVLHSRPYRENQLILELLTEFDGKQAVLSYIGHSSKSSRKALLQPFLPLKVTLKGQQSLKSLTRVEPIGKSYLLKKNALFSAFYINELLVKLLGENIACSELFRQYKITLQSLTSASNIEVCLREFELNLMDELGVSFDFSLVFEHNADGFYYLPEEGFIPAYTKLQQPCYHRQHLQAIAEHDLSQPEVLTTFKALMRQVINHLLKGVPLNSRKLFSRKL